MCAVHSQQKLLRGEIKKIKAKSRVMHKMDIKFGYGRRHRKARKSEEPYTLAVLTAMGRNAS